MITNMTKGITNTFEVTREGFDGNYKLNAWVRMYSEEVVLSLNDSDLHVFSLEDASNVVLALLALGMVDLQTVTEELKTLNNGGSV